MKRLFDKTSYNISKLVTRSYSTSFSLGIQMLGKDIRSDIFAIYGFVRFADEIVDSFHDFDKASLLSDFEEQTYSAINQKISLNPILNSFQETVNKYNIDHNLIDQFLHSMKMDLNPINYSQSTYQEYIVGSAEVVGLICLKVFCQGNELLYQQLIPGARSLGAAFQKVNFLRDIKSDQQELGRIYFPNWKSENFSEPMKKEIEQDILNDFNLARKAIRKLPKVAKFGVYSAYVYYKALFMKIERTRPNSLFSRRVRISNGLKFLLLCCAKMNIKLKRV